MLLVENLEKYGVRHCTTTTIIWTKQQRAGRVHGAEDRRASHTTPANGRSAVIGDRERERGAGNWFDWYLSTQTFQLKERKKETCMIGGSLTPVSCTSSSGIVILPAVQMMASRTEWWPVHQAPVVRPLATKSMSRAAGWSEYLIDEWVTHACTYSYASLYLWDRRGVGAVMSLRVGGALSSYNLKANGHGSWACARPRRATHNTHRSHLEMSGAEHESNSVLPCLPSTVSHANL